VKIETLKSSNAGTRELDGSDTIYGKMRAGQERAVHNLLNTLAHTLTRLERLEGTIHLYHRTVTMDIKSQVQQILRWDLLSTRCTLSLSLSCCFPPLLSLSFSLFLFLSCFLALLFVSAQESTVRPFCEIGGFDMLFWGQGSAAREGTGG